MVLDLGGNLGEFSKALSSVYGCTADVVEASPELFDRIGVTPLIRKHHYAVSGENGTVTFYESTDAEAGNVIAPKTNATGKTFEVESRDLPTLIKELQLEHINLLKIDIEGAETTVFENLHENDLDNVRQLTIEFHDSVPIPNVTPEEAGRMIGKINAMGFYGIKFGRRNFNWLFINKRAPAFNRFTRAYLFVRHRLTARC